MKTRIWITLLGLCTITGPLYSQVQDSVCATIVGKEESDSMLRVYPNPAEKIVHINYGSRNSCPPIGWGGTLQIYIIYSNGEVVFKESVEEFEGEYNREVDMEKQQKGTYLVQIAAGTMKFSRRLFLK
jgi:hypothetical protein